MTKPHTTVHYLPNVESICTACGYGLWERFTGHPYSRDYVMRECTQKPEEVTCSECLDVLASEVEQALDLCTGHGAPKPRDQCDVCMGRGVWGGIPK